jgi:uncharacterized protein
MEITVVDVPGQERYEARTADGAVAGFAAYHLATNDPDTNVIVMTHTEVDPSFEGHGVATILIRGALDDIRAKGLPIRALCPFVVAFLEGHPDYQDLEYVPATPE